MCDRDLDRFACFGIPNLMCCYVTDVEGAAARETYRLNVCKVDFIILLPRSCFCRAVFGHEKNQSQARTGILL